MNSQFSSSTLILTYGQFAIFAVVYMAIGAGITLCTVASVFKNKIK